MYPNSDELYALIAKLLTDQLSDTELARLEKWKSEKIENLQEYNDIVSLWIQSGSLKMPGTIDLVQTQDKVYREAGIYSAKKRWFTWGFQAAAVLALSLVFSGIFSYLGRNNTSVSSDSGNPVYQEISAAYGTQTKVSLADGTLVYLNSGSKLIFPQTFRNRGQREVTLEGEGYFEVAKNKEQSFVVNANKLSIKVLGTKFNVDAYNDNLSVCVALAEGSVEIQEISEGKSDKPFMLVPNQLANFDVAARTLTKTDITDLNKYTAWINGRIVFFGDPIQTVVKKLSKWYNVDIVISDKKLENYRFTGTFINEPVEQVLNVLSMTSPMTFLLEQAVRQEDNSMSKRKIILKSKI